MIGRSPARATTVLDATAATRSERIAAVRVDRPTSAVDLVALLLDEARRARASDLHFQPTADGLEVHARIDGILARWAVLPSTIAANVVARLKVLADLLTYRADVPQEGRIRGPLDPAGGPGGEVRVSTFPTLHGERAAVRLFAAPGERHRLADLGLPGEVAEALSSRLDETAGAILLTGPAGSGKTTTVYACLRELVNRTGGSRAIATLEDPIESALDGVAQAQVNPGVGFDFANGLRSLLRQDPEVLVVGEVRDRATAEVAFQASLTGHLVLSTFHAGTAAGAISRLVEMGIEPYLIRSGLAAVVSQRLVRRLCPDCAAPVDPADAGAGSDDRLGLRVAPTRRAVGCPPCGGSGYRGRAVLAEWLDPSRLDLASLRGDQFDQATLQGRAESAGLVSLTSRAEAAVAAGITTPAEVRRVLGFGRLNPDQT